MSRRGKRRGARLAGAVLRVFFFYDMLLSVYIRSERRFMPDTLTTLEVQRSKLLEDFLGLHDLRPGSITAVTRRCGKSSCHCAKRNDPGHDPQFRLTRRVAGDRKSTRLNSSHLGISYAVFCLKKKNKSTHTPLSR